MLKEKKVLVTSGKEEASVRKETVAVSATRPRSVARRWGPKACDEQAAADPSGSRTCMCANTFGWGGTCMGGDGRINVLPWYRLVSVAKTSSETQRRKSRAAQKG